MLWPLTDHLGTVRDWLNNSATNVDHVEYDSFGKRLDTPAIDAAFGWTGRYRDSLTGLQYNNARWYDPAIGRWLSEDFIWDGTNKYSYVGNMPTAYVDPSGLETTAPTAGGQQNSKSKPSRQYDLMREFGTNQRGSAFAKDVRPILETTGEVIAETNPISGTLLSECRIIFGYDPLRDQEVNDAQRGREALMIIGTTAIGAIISRMRLGGEILSVEDATAKAARLRSVPLAKQLRHTPAEQRFLLGEAMGNQVGSGKVAHHIIPIEAISKHRELIERAAKGGFDINGCNNGILLRPGIDHIGNHRQYNKEVLEYLGRIQKQIGQLTDREIAGLIQETADALRKAIEKKKYGPWG